MIRSSNGRPSSSSPKGSTKQPPPPERFQPKETVSRSEAARQRGLAYIPPEHSTINTCGGVH